MKQECRHTRELLSGYIDGVLTPGETSCVREHLALCPDCEREHASLMSLITGLSSMDRLKAPNDFLAKFHDRVGKASLFDSIRGFLPFPRIRISAELAAFATTALLIAFLFTLFTGDEKDLTTPVAENSTQSVVDRETSTVRIAANPYQGDRTSGDDASYPTPEKEQQPVKLAMVLTARRQVSAVPSQSVSYGNPGYGFTDDDTYLWPSDQGAVVEDRLLKPDEVNQRIDDIIRSVDGRIISREDDTETGYPARLTIETPAVNYSRFLLRIEDLGALKAPAPGLTDATGDAMVLIQMELTNE